MAEDYLADARGDSIDDLEGLGFQSVTPKNSEDTTDDELGNAFFVDFYSVWKLGQTDRDRAREVLKGVVDPSDDRTFERVMQKVGTGGSALLTDLYETLDWTNNFYKTNYQNIPSNGLAMRVLTQRIHDDPTDTGVGFINQITYQQQIGKSPNGNEFKKFVIKKMVSTDDSDYVADLPEDSWQ